MRRSLWRAASLVASLALVTVPLTACGNDQTPAAAVPELSQRLEQVDAALAAGQQNKAREAIDALLEEAAQARVDGDLSADQADQILRAATELKRALGEVGSDGSTPSDPSASDPFYPPEASEEDREGEDRKRNDKGDDDDKDEKDDEKEPRGDGSSHGNGHDNGRGNGG